MAWSIVLAFLAQALAWASSFGHYLLSLETTATSVALMFLTALIHRPPTRLARASTTSSTSAATRRFRRTAPTMSCWASYARRC